MHKVVWFVKFRPDGDRAELDRRWATDHAALCVQVPGVQRYVQNPVVTTATLEGATDGPPPWDGFAAFWWADRDAYLAAMAEARQARLRAGAMVWRLYEDVARHERWTELWAVESWTEHLREEARLDEADRAALARAAAMHRGDEPPKASRHLNVDPLAEARHAPAR